MNALLPDRAISGNDRPRVELAPPTQRETAPLVLSEPDRLGDDEFLHPTGWSDASMNRSQQVETPDVSVSLAIVIVESRSLLREALAKTLQSACLRNVVAYAHVAEALRDKDHFLPSVVLLSVAEQSEEAVAHEVALVTAKMPQTPIIVIGRRDDLEAALRTLSAGAKGYLTTNMSLQIVLEAMKFVIAGGTYLPAEWILAARRPVSHETSGGLSSRDRAVLQGIRLGKPNKVIAYELNMCESTVKVHVRQIMKKLRVKNRTEAAIKAAAIFADSGEEPADEE
jgi:DNA-binding NarL/FixJ family response regulator